MYPTAFEDAKEETYNYFSLPPEEPLDETYHS
jgi:hypothetical protein